MANKRGRSFQAALKALVGYQSKDGDNARAVLAYPTHPTQFASATTVTIPTEGLVFEITGTTTIANLLVEGGDILEGRKVVLRGVSGTNAAITDTALASTAEGKIHLNGGVTLANGESLELWQGANGSWTEYSYSESIG